MTTLLEELRKKLKEKNLEFQHNEVLILMLEVIGARFADHLGGWSRLKDVEAECRVNHENRRNQLDKLESLIRHVQHEVGLMRQTSDPKVVTERLDQTATYYKAYLGNAEKHGAEMQTQIDILRTSVTTLQGTVDALLRAMVVKP